MRKIAAVTLFFILALPVAGRADDFGPPHDVGTVRADGRTLLAHRARLAKVDPKTVGISDVVVVGDQAVLSWDIGTQHGVMGLVRQNNRWWDGFDSLLFESKNNCWSTASRKPWAGFSNAILQAARAHNRAFAAQNVPPPTSRPGHLAKYCWSGEIYNVPKRAAVLPRGGPVQIDDSESDPYQINIRLAPNNAQPSTNLTRLYARPPTPAEFLPYPTPYNYTSDALMFFDIVFEGPKPVSFQKGTTMDVWFPFALDDTLKYRLSFGGGQESIGPIIGSVFDNVVHFDLPGFTAFPGKELMGEIDGDVH